MFMLLPARKKPVLFICDSAPALEISAGFEGGLRASDTTSHTGLVSSSRVSRLRFYFAWNYVLNSALDETPLNIG